MCKLSACLCEAAQVFVRTICKKTRLVLGFYFFKCLREFLSRGQYAQRMYIFFVQSVKIGPLMAHRRDRGVERKRDREEEEGRDRGEERK
jgi:hypothetical protein